MSTAIPAPGRLTVILSGEREYRSDEANYGYHCLLRKHLAKHLAHGDLYSVHECEGAYKGTPERSIAITGPATLTLAIGRKLGKAFVQESILAIDHHGQGKLYFTDGDDDSHSTIGRLVVTVVPDELEAWTRILATDETFYFI